MLKSLLRRCITHINPLLPNYYQTSDTNTKGILKDSCFGFPCCFNNRLILKFFS